MQIAIIGWGSLIWAADSLKLGSRWHRSGPVVPIEFARISVDGRLTLVIHPPSKTQTTLWALASLKDLHEVREDLRKREGTALRFIHTGTGHGDYSEGVTEVEKGAIASWLRDRPDIEACVWTGLPSNWEEKQNTQYSAEGAVHYLKERPDPARAKEYVQKTPTQIQTDARTLIRTELGWCDAELPGILFEDG